MKDHPLRENDGANEQLGIVSTPLPPQTPSPKKVRKLAVEGGIPASLRGRVWAWFLSGTMSARRPGLYTQLLEHEKRGDVEGRIDRDVARWVSAFLHQEKPPSVTETKFSGQCRVKWAPLI